MLRLLLPRLVKNNHNAPPPNFLPSTHQYILFTHVEAIATLKSKVKSQKLEGAKLEVIPE
ncbi:hypothetical protein [Okeania sp. KiyG1]|uniref:hypothetical protein n=1 Tax=Okeania sp. KiyG1 TaxID=2720165 RepID=UPI001922E70E|nr:hypothetical protein [Okeania sp. KiyG1]